MNNEIDEILNSLKNRNDNSENLMNNSDLAPPVKSRAQKVAEETEKPKPDINDIIAKSEPGKENFESEKSNFTINVQESPEIEPPKPLLSKQAKADEEIQEKQKADLSANKAQKKKKEKTVKKQKSEKTKTEKTDYKSSNFRTIVTGLFKKQIPIILGIIVLIVAVAFGTYKLYDYSKVAYLKPYEQKYNIEYPEGILEEFCDEYGKNQNVMGKIIIDDTNTDKYVSSQTTNGYVLAEKGTDVFKEQQFRALDLTGYADLESVYSTPDGFLSSTQKVTFNTLFEKEEYRVVDAFYTNTNPDDDNGYRFPYNAYGTMTEKSFESYADRINSRRLYDTGYEPLYEDAFLTLSVDSDFMDNFKFVVVCVKTDDKEFEKSTIAAPKDKIHYPQVWYDANNQDNPYIFAGKWYPEIYTNSEKQKTTKLSIEDFE